VALEMTGSGDDARDGDRTDSRMANIVVGGSGRNVGKTALVCGLIAALPEYGWIAVKITGHSHGLAEPVHEEKIAEQEEDSGEDSACGTDTARYLAAGARRALLVTARGGDVPMVEMRAALGTDGNFIFETNRLAVGRADVCFAVIGGDKSQWKPSFEDFLRGASAVVVHGNEELRGVKLPPELRVFREKDFGEISVGMAEWVRKRLSSEAAL